MSNFLRIRDFSTDEIMHLINLAEECKTHKYDNYLKDHIVANLFFEPSTRTQYSFNTAEERLGMKVINFNPSASSMNKGESFYDTCKTFESFGIDAMVIRSKIDGYYEQLKNFKPSIINAGDGVCDHPSQTMLDLITIYEEFHHFEGLKIAIVGDIKHSRVAHSNIEVMKRLKMECYISGPKEYCDEDYDFIELDEAIEKMDIIMLLRVQHERHAEKYDVKGYNDNFGLNASRVSKMKDSAIIMHPAPFNRNVEITDDVVECEKSRIFKQMTNGVYARMAMILHSLKGI